MHLIQLNGIEYRNLRRLGAQFNEGSPSLSDVFLGTFGESGPEIVIKIYKPDNITVFRSEVQTLKHLNQTEIADWPVEASAAARLQKAQITYADRYIIALIDHSPLEANSTEHILVMEKAPPPVLLPMTDEFETLQLAAQAASAMALCHERANVAWADLNPLTKADRLRWDSANQRLKVIDWNVTDQAGYAKKQQDLLWLSAILFSVFTGQLPMGKEYTLPVNLNDMSPSWDRLSYGTHSIFQKALSPIPAQRYQSAQNLAAAFAGQAEIMQLQRDGNSSELLARASRLRTEQQPELAIALYSAALNTPGLSTSQQYLASEKLRQAKKQLSSQGVKELESVLSLMNNGFYRSAQESLDGLKKTYQEQQESPLYRRIIYLQKQNEILQEWRSVGLEKDNGSKLLDEVIQQISPIEADLVNYKEADDQVNKLAIYVGKTQALSALMDDITAHRSRQEIESWFRRQKEPEPHIPDWEDRQQQWLKQLKEKFASLQNANGKAIYHAPFEDIMWQIRRPLKDWGVDSGPGDDGRSPQLMQIEQHLASIREGNVVEARQLQPTSGPDELPPALQRRLELLSQITVPMAQAQTEINQPLVENDGAVSQIAAIVAALEEVKNDLGEMLLVFRLTEHVDHLLRQLMTRKQRLEENKRQQQLRQVNLQKLQDAVATIRTQMNELPQKPADSPEWEEDVTATIDKLKAFQRALQRQQKELEVTSPEANLLADQIGTQIQQRQGDLKALQNIVVIIQEGNYSAAQVDIDLQKRKAELTPQVQQRLEYLQDLLSILRRAKDSGTASFEDIVAWNNALQQFSDGHTITLWHWVRPKIEEVVSQFATQTLAQTQKWQERKKYDQALDLLQQLIVTHWPESARQLRQQQISEIFRQKLADLLSKGQVTEAATLLERFQEYCSKEEHLQWNRMVSVYRDWGSLENVSGDPEATADWEQKEDDVVQKRQALLESLPQGPMFEKLSSNLQERFSLQKRSLEFINQIVDGLLQGDNNQAAQQLREATADNFTHQAYQRITKLGELAGDLADAQPSEEIGTGDFVDGRTKLAARQRRLQSIEEKASLWTKLAKFLTQQLNELAQSLEQHGWQMVRQQLGQIQRQPGNYQAVAAGLPGSFSGVEDAGHSRFQEVCQKLATKDYANAQSLLQQIQTTIPDDIFAIVDWDIKWLMSQHWLQDHDFETHGFLDEANTPEARKDLRQRRVDEIACAQKWHEVEQTIIREEREGADKFQWATAEAFKMLQKNELSDLSKISPDNYEQAKSLAAYNNRVSDFENLELNAFKDKYNEGIEDAFTQIHKETEFSWPLLRLIRLLMVERSRHVFLKKAGGYRQELTISNLDKALQLYQLSLMAAEALKADHKSASYLGIGLDSDVSIRKERQDTQALHAALRAVDDKTWQTAINSIPEDIDAQSVRDLRWRIAETILRQGLTEVELPESPAWVDMRRAIALPHQTNFLAIPVKHEPFSPQILELLEKKQRELVESLDKEARRIEQSRRYSQALELVLTNLPQASQRKTTEELTRHYDYMRQLQKKALYDAAINDTITLLVLGEPCHWALLDKWEYVLGSKFPTLPEELDFNDQEIRDFISWFQGAEAHRQRIQISLNRHDLDIAYILATQSHPTMVFNRWNKLSVDYIAEQMQRHSQHMVESHVLGNATRLNEALQSSDPLAQVWNLVEQDRLGFLKESNRPVGSLAEIERIEVFKDAAILTKEPSVPSDLSAKLQNVLETAQQRRQDLVDSVKQGLLSLRMPGQQAQELLNLAAKLGLDPPLNLNLDHRAARTLANIQPGNIAAFFQDKAGLSWLGDQDSNLKTWLNIWQSIEQEIERSMPNLMDSWRAWLAQESDEIPMAFRELVKSTKAAALLDILEEQIELLGKPGVEMLAKRVEERLTLLFQALSEDVRRNVVNDLSHL